MDFQGILQQLIDFAGTFSPKLIIALFLLLTVGEFGIAIPYVLETVWLMTGYHVVTGMLSPLHAVLLFLAALMGREVGVSILYYVSRFGSAPLVKLYHRYFATTTSEKGMGKNTLPFLLHRFTSLTPFSVAVGRLVWLRVPLTLTLGARKRLGVLMAGVLLSSLVWDGVYIALGTLGGTVRLKPFQMALYSLAFLTVLYLVTFILRRLPALPLSKGRAK